MTVPRGSLVTSTDVALLRSLVRERSLVAASRRVGISRDRAVYRIERLERAFGGPVVRAVRGGAGHGGSSLTALGDRIVRGGFDSVELLDAHPLAPLATPNLLHGVYSREPVPQVRVGRSLCLQVAFVAEDGAKVALLLDPESVVIARQRFASSARNVLRAVVEAVRREGSQVGVTLVVRLGRVRLRVAITEETVHQFRLKPGAVVWLYVKATALRRVGEPDRSETGPTPH